MAANQYGIDMADIYRTTAAVKGARTQNKLNELQLSEAQYKVDQRPVEEARKNELKGLRTESVMGNTGAQKMLLALDPENGPSFIDAIGKMDEARRAGVKRNIDEIGRGSMFVLSGKTPEQQAQRYQTLRENMSPEAAAGLPEVYDPAFMELSLSKATAMDKLLEAPKSVGVGGVDVLYKGGREIERANKPVKAGGSGGNGGNGGNGGLKSADESFMMKSAVNLLGGMYDRDGNITALSKIARSDAQAITTRATELYSKGGITRSRAVMKAARELDIEIPELTENNQEAEDPLGIR